MSDFEAEKTLAALKSVEYIEDGMAVGLGSGSTARHFVHALGERVRQGLVIKAIPTSKKTKALAIKEGIPLTDFGDIKRLDVTVDGADEIDPNLNLIKGGGGALLREKIVATATDCFIVVADSRKPVATLGAFPLPVEVIPFGWQNVAESIKKLNSAVELRIKENGRPFRTSQRNFVLDCRFEEIPDPVSLGIELRRIIGVVEHGLFVGMTDTAIIGKNDSVEIISGIRGR
jgi:ribose 5-phosphate isomerase A